MNRTALLTPPNLLSLSRFFLAALFVLAQRPSVRLALLVTASLSDMMDGWLARRMQSTTRWGALLDPIADRVFVLVALLVFVAEGVFNAWQAVLFLARDIMTTIGFLVARRVSWLRPVTFKARPAGKLVTVLQLITLYLAVIRPSIAPSFVLLVGAAAAVAIVDYTLALWRARVR